MGTGCLGVGNSPVRWFARPEFRSGVHAFIFMDRREQVSNQLTVESLRGLLNELKSLHHYIYALWMHGTMHTIYAIDAQDNKYSLKETIKGPNSIAHNTPISVVFHKTVFSSLDTLTIDNIIKVYISYLAIHCEVGLRINSPVQLTPEFIEHYHLTSEDVEILNSHLLTLNDMAKESLQRQYDELKALDCIKK